MVQKTAWSALAYLQPFRAYRLAISWQKKQTYLIVLRVMISMSFIHPHRLTIPISYLIDTMKIERLIKMPMISVIF